jgi:hypothetical protein
VGLRLKDRKKLRPIIENKIDVLLFGHLHSDSSSVGKDFNSSWGIPSTYNAGSATHKNGNPGIHRVINLKKMAYEDSDGKFI